MNTVELIDTEVTSFTILTEDRLFLRKGLTHEVHELVYKDYKSGNVVQITKKSEFKLQEIYIDQGRVWVRRFEGGTLYFDVSTLELQTTPLLIAKFITNDEALAVFRDEEGVKRFCLYNFKRNEKIWVHENSSTIFSVHKNTVMLVKFKHDSIEKELIRGISLTSGETLWEVSFKDIEAATGASEIERILGVYRDSFIIALNKNTFIALDTTGKLTDSWKFVMNLVRGSFLSEGKLHGLNEDVFSEADLESKQLHTYEVALRDMRISEFWHGSFISFVATRGSGEEYNNRIVGAFDPRAKKLVWIDELPIPPEDHIREMKSIDSTIFIQTALGRLFKIKV